MIGDIQRGGVQTSFIPKKPLTSYGQKESAGLSAILNFISIIVFVVSLSAFGGALFYKSILNSDIVNLKSTLSEVQKQLENKDSEMKEIIRFDSKLNNIGILLDNHITLRNLFGFLEESTMTGVRFNEFNYSNKGNGSIDLRLSGEALDYNWIALQADEFQSAKKLGDKNFTDIIFSDFNPVLSGNVVFKATAKVVPAIIYYKNQL